MENITFLTFKLYNNGKYYESANKCYQNFRSNFDEFLIVLDCEIK